MRGFLMAFGVVGLHLLATSVSLGSQVLPVEVMQPHFTENGLYLNRVTYFMLVGPGPTEIAVRWTCEPYEAKVLGAEPHDARDVNLASSTGLKLQLSYGNRLSAKPGRWEFLFGDTMRVLLDATSLTGQKLVDGLVSDSMLVVATVECILVNAARYGGVPLVQVEIRGRESIMRLGGVFATEKYRCAPRKWHWVE